MIGGESREEEIHSIVENIDAAGNGEINYSEFIAATLHSRHEITDEQIWSVFKRIDEDNTGYITEQNLTDLMLKQSKTPMTRFEI
jgi:calcium-dependent protein kinase